MVDVEAAVKAILDGFDDPIEGQEAVKAALHVLSPLNAQPVDHVQWVPVDRVTANDYNPNTVAGKEMKLLRHSIDMDGYTQPIVTVYDEEKDSFVIVDGFHRYYICKTSEAVLARNHGRVPVVVIKKDIADRMASTVRHNRARGKHSIDGMSSIIFEMLEKGLGDAAICNEIGMEPEELLRLKHITGFSKLFEDAEYHQSWIERRQLQIRMEYRKTVAEEAGLAVDI